MERHPTSQIAGQAFAPHRLFKTLAAVALAGLLAACAPEPPAPVAVPDPPPVRPERVEDPDPVAPVSQASRDLSLYYRRLQNDLISQRMLRSDDGEGDYPLTAENLARDFTRIALYDEYTVTASGRLTADSRISRLRRWQMPVRVKPHFGPAAPPEQQARDTASLAAYADRLRNATGHPVNVTHDTDGNLHVLFLSEDERAAAIPMIRQLAPGIAQSSLDALRDMPRATLCMAVAMTPPAGHAYIRGVIVIRSELPDALRLACIHEEISQALGLANDHPQARPSIFNDDSEFALLTRHDRLLLQILYDARLSPGMTAAEAAPVAHAIAQELLAPPPAMPEVSAQAPDTKQDTPQEAAPL